MRFKVPFAVALVLALAGCQIGPGGGETVLENGAVITGEERAMLEALEPEFEVMLAELDAEAEAQGIGKGTAQYGELLSERSRRFLEDRVGEGYEKYIIEEEMLLGDSLGRAANRKSSGYVKFLYKGSLYYLQYYAKYIRLPWGTHGWAGTGIADLAGRFVGGAFMSATEYSDEVTPKKGDLNLYKDANGNGVVEVQELVSSHSHVRGNRKKGFFPKLNGVVTAEFWVVHYILEDGIRGDSSNWVGTFNGKGGWHSGKLYFRM